MGSKQPQRPPFPPPPPPPASIEIHLLPALPVVWSAMNEDAEPLEIPAGELPAAIACPAEPGDFVIGASKARFTIVARGHAFLEGVGPVLVLVVTPAEDE